MNKRSRRNLLIIVGVVLFIALFAFFNKASFQRGLKSFKSDYSGGLNRTITVYDYSGNVVQTYSGKIDVESYDTGKVLFDLNGKRTIIYGGIIVIQEE